MTENRFASITSVDELIGHVVGAGSSPTLWMSERIPATEDPMSYAEPLPATQDTLGRPCIFDSAAASAIVDDARERLAQLLEEQPPTYPIATGDELGPYCVRGTIVEARTGSVYLYARHWGKIAGPASNGSGYIDMPVRVLRAGDGR